MLASSIADRLAQQARFVFKGKVRKLGASTMAELTADDSTVIVTVEEIVHAPPILARYEGKDITVRLPAKKKKLAVGEEVVFFTNSLRIGKSIAVQAIDHLPTAKALKAERVALAVRPNPVEELADRELRNQIEEADAVVSGRVTSVRVPEAPAEKLTKRPLASYAQSAALPFERVSEHDPIWHEAIVEVQAVHKGSGTPKEIVIRFPRSTDVRWYRYPKFEPGHQGVFVLRRAPSAARTAGQRLAVGPNVFTAEHPTSFQPSIKAEKIKNIIQTPASSGALKPRRTR